MADIFSKCAVWDETAALKSSGLYPFFRCIEQTDGRTVTVDGRRLIMVGSNNYLGLTHHPRVLEAAQAALLRYGTGCTGSRLLNGNIALHEELEARLAHFLGKESALVFATGFLANQGALSALAGRHDVIYSDSENHASIIEGTRVALGDKINFRHNNLADLERALVNTRSKYKGALIVADGVFSMSGDIFKLQAARAMANKYDCRLFIDDAHSMGVLGHQGRGTESHCGLPGAADVVMGTFSKSFSSVGGVIASSRKVVDYIRHKARAFVFTAALPPAACATVLACLDILESEPQHLENLWRNARFMQNQLQALGFDTLHSKTPVVPVVIGEELTAFAFARRLFEQGIFATPVITPAVPKGKAMIRTSYMATHTAEDLATTLEVFERTGREFGILGTDKNAVVYPRSLQPAA